MRFQNQGLKTGSFAMTHGRTPIVGCPFERSRFWESCANEAHHEKSYREMYSFLCMVDFQLDWSGLVTAAILTGWFAAEWCIRIWIFCENQTLWLKCQSLSLTFYTVITFRGDVVPYYGAWCSISRTLAICRQWSRWLTFIAVIGWYQVSCARGAVGIAALLCRWQTAGGGSIPRWSASKTQDRRPAERQQARTKKKWLVGTKFHLGSPLSQDGT